MKTCSLCRKTKHLDDFSIRKTPDGPYVSPRCKECMSDLAMRWYEDHKEEAKARMRAYMMEYRRQGRDQRFKKKKEAKSR